MKEIIVKNNTTGLGVFINGVPNISLVPKDEADCIITALELQIAEYYKPKSKRNDQNNAKNDIAPK